MKNKFRFDQLFCRIDWLFCLYYCIYQLFMIMQTFVIIKFSLNTCIIWRNPFTIRFIYHQDTFELTTLKIKLLLVCHFELTVLAMKFPLFNRIYNFLIDTIEIQKTQTIHYTTSWIISYGARWSVTCIKLFIVNKF